MAIPLSGGDWTRAGAGGSFGGASGRPNRFESDPSDWLAFRQRIANTPDIFNVALNLARESVVFRVGNTNAGVGRSQIASYNIRFISADLVSSSTINSIEGARSAFNIADIVVSTGAPGPGGIVIAESVNQFGKDGYYFATAVTQAGRDSTEFAGPVKAPLPGSITTNATPPDVSSVDLDVTTETVRGRSVRKLTFSAIVPSNGKGVVSIFVLNPGSGYTPGTNYPVQFSGGNGLGASAIAITNSSGGIDRILVAETGNNYTIAPSAAVAPGGAVLDVQLGASSDFAGYQIYIDGYFGNLLQESQTISGGNAKFPGSTLTGAFYLLPDTPPTGGDIDFYFVSISSTGSRRADPTASPVFTLAGGLT
jgi:hypothetical protein